MTKMKNLTRLLCCPICLGSLASEESRFECKACERLFPLRLGIPDFRLFPPSACGYMSEDEDLKRATVLFEAYEKASYEDLVRVWIDSLESHLSSQLKDHYLQYRLKNHERVAQLAHLIRKQTALTSASTVAPRIGLDIGCGSGSGIAALLEVVDQAVGIDITFSDMILAKKFLSTYYPGRQVLLVAGVAEHLPFANSSFPLVIARDIIEHVASQKQFICEAHRVLRSDGTFLTNTESRFIWIEPHTLLPGVGYLPRALQPLYVRLARRRGYKIHLPSVGELNGWFENSPFRGNWRIIYLGGGWRDPRMPPRTRRGRLVRAIPGLFGLINGIRANLSSFEVIAEKFK